MYHLYFNYQKKILIFLIFVLFSNQILAQTNLKQANYKKSFAEKVLELNQKTKNAKKNKEWDKYFAFQRDLASLYISKKQWKLAKFIIERNIEKSQRKQNIISLAHNYRQLAIWHQQQLNSQQAILFFEKALSNYSQKLPEKNNWISQVYCDIGQLYLQEHNFYRATQYLFKSINLYNSKDLDLLSRIYGNIASLYQHKKIINLAETYLQKSLQVQLHKYDKDDLHLTNVYLQFANLYIDSDQYYKAKPYLEKALSIYQQYGEKDSKGLANTYYIFGKIEEVKSLSRSFDLYQKSLTIHQNVYSQNSPKLSKVLLAMAQNLEKQQKFWQALDFYQKSIIINTKNFQDSVLFSNPKLLVEEEANEESIHEFFDYYQDQVLLESLYGKANILRKIYWQDTQNIHYLKLAYETIKLSDKILQKITSNTFCQIQKIETTWDDIIQQNNNLGIEVALELYNIEQSKEYFEKGFYFGERNKSNILLKSISDSRNKKYIDIPDSLKKLEAKIIRQIASYEQKLAQQPDSLKALMYQDELFVLNKAYENLQKVMAQQCTPCFVSPSEIIPDIATIQTILDKQTALLAYNFAEERSWLFVITKEKYLAFPLGSKEKMQTLFNNFYNHIQNESSLEEFAEVSFDIYKKLLKPAKIHLQGKKNLIIIEPLLLSIPFEAVIAEQNKINNQDFGKLDYLLNTYNISYHYSSALWYFRKNEKENKTNNFIGFAPFSEENAGVFKTLNLEILPNTSTELGRIYGMFHKSGIYAETYFSGFASKEKFLEKVRYFNILHIASHSRPDFENENMAKLYLANWEHPEQEACLLAGNVYHLDILADLVVLSSCESGVGKFNNSEGVLSLARSFLHAGANNVISSLWEADDKYTSELMVSFYHQLLNKQKNYAQALRTAKRSLQKKYKNLHPKYWSDFILIGRED